jgi:hypothetical protein
MAKARSKSKPKPQSKPVAKPKAKSKTASGSSEQFLITFEVAILKADGTYTTDSIDLVDAQVYSHEEVATAYHEEHPQLDPAVVLAVIAHE